MDISIVDLFTVIISAGGTFTDTLNSHLGLNTPPVELAFQLLPVKQIECMYCLQLMEISSNHNGPHQEASISTAEVHPLLIYKQQGLLY